MDDSEIRVKGRERGGGRSRAKVAANRRGSDRARGRARRRRRRAEAWGSARRLLKARKEREGRRSRWRARGTAWGRVWVWVWVRGRGRGRGRGGYFYFLFKMNWALSFLSLLLSYILVYISLYLIIPWSPVNRCKGINESKNHMIKTSHPSPLGAYKTASPFMGSKYVLILKYLSWIISYTDILLFSFVFWKISILLLCVGNHQLFRYS